MYGADGVVSRAGSHRRGLASMEPGLKVEI